MAQSQSKSIQNQGPGPPAPHLLQDDEAAFHLSQRVGSSARGPSGTRWDGSEMSGFPIGWLMNKGH